MENILEYRDRVGVPDAILLEEYESEDAFVDNLQKRYKEDIIYTYIGQVLVSINPFKPLDIYDERYLEKYRKSNLYEVPPHAYALAENAYRSMSDASVDNCILISGESGAGKTEASKHLLNFIAASSKHRRNVVELRHKLLESNPVLEAFGNAKTLRNDNSSRFGKYMDIECNFKNEPIGGHIKNYLLEKSRVVHQKKGERSFHAFYQLLAGATPVQCCQMFLEKDPKKYAYLKEGLVDDEELLTPKDKTSFENVASAISLLGFTQEEQDGIWSIVAAILHFGNLKPTQNDDESVTIPNKKELHYISKLLKCDESKIEEALTQKTIETKNDAVKTSLTLEEAYFARDAIAKSMYGRLFDWLVERLNTSLRGAVEEGRSNRIGILDIYGFEIFEKNGFEQFCINYCNEKLQQVFIELTLKSEQEEYLSEGIQWENVEYFDNKIICDLIEKPHQGIIPLMDEECLRPGDANDTTLLDKMDTHLGCHRHYLSYNGTLKKTKTKYGLDEFRLRHYAGDVAYSVKGFVEKNNDLLFRDLKSLMTQTDHVIVSQLFPKKELQQMKRPATSATQFKRSLSQLMSTLMDMEPSYIRCIKPNDFQRPDDFNVELIRHQVKYLGLMENVRVRRAGFAYRRNYNYFLERYKSLCASTWPNFDGPAKEGVQKIIEHLNYVSEEYRLGRSKIFIRFPKTLFLTEDKLQTRKHELATFLQSRWKGKMQRRKFLAMVQAVTTLAKHWKRILAQKERERIKWASLKIQMFIQGFITRNEKVTEVNSKFQSFVKYKWLMKMSATLPNALVGHSFPEAPKSCAEASTLLEEMHKTYLARRYVKNLSSKKKTKFLEKIKAEEIFKDKKANYKTLFPFWFKTSRLTQEEEGMRQLYFSNLPFQQMVYCTPCYKYDRSGYKERPRILIITSSNIYIFEVKERKFRVKEKYSLAMIEQLFVTPNCDGFLMIKMATDDEKINRGDLILSVVNVIEAATKIVLVSKKEQLVTIINSTRMNHVKRNGKEGVVVLKPGEIPSINKNKEGQLVVVGCQ